MDRLEEIMWPLCVLVGVAGFFIFVCLAIVVDNDRARTMIQAACVEPESIACALAVRR